MRLRAFLFAIGLMSVAAPALATLPRGNHNFRLGMDRAQVDSALTARKVPIISNGTAFLVCGSEDPLVEYEQYSFFRVPHGADILWRVTIGYRLNASPADYAAAREDLLRTLGEPTTDTWKAGDEVPPLEQQKVMMSQRVIWADAAVVVQLGGRWSDAQDASADRIIVGWTDRRLQRLVEARRKKPGSGS